MHARGVEDVKAYVAVMRLIRIVIHCEAFVVDNLSYVSPLIAAARCRCLLCHVCLPVHSLVLCRRCLNAGFNAVNLALQLSLNSA